MQLRKLFFKISLFFAIMFFTLSLIFYGSYRQDLAYLKSIVETQITTEKTPGVFDAINHWVYQNKGFKKNQEYFLFKLLGPTPIQILNSGGDCSDKSLLLMTMLKSVGINSTLIMLFGVDGRTSTHTVVEVREGEFRAVADPVFDIVFPNPRGGFYNIHDLRNNPALMLNRLDDLLELRGRSNKIVAYRRVNETYQFSSAINWNKNKSLQFVSNLLGKVGIDARDIARPHVLDDPKLLISAVLLVLSFFLGLPLICKKNEWIE